MVISLLEEGRNPEIFRDSFFYFLTAGLACLYLGDTGSASSYFQRARHIRMTDPTLLNAQAVLYLRRGDTEKAIQYYLDVLEYDPDNKTALSAMEFLKTHGSYEEICKLVDTGEIEKFYPPLGVNPDTVKRIGLSVLAGIVLAILLFNITNLTTLSKRFNFSKKTPGDLSSLFLTLDERKNPQQKDLSNAVFRYILNDKQILKTYENAVQYYGAGRENAAQVEVNRLLNSNASDAIKQNANTVASYFQEQSFDSLVDNFGYSDVAQDPVLYLGCWVVWSGRVSNAVTEGKSYRCDLLVGYENMDRVEGFVPLYFDEAPVPAIDGERPVRVLARIESKDGKLVLSGRAVYQPLKTK
ncbi:MAG: tetratricopeptide repeat protein [Treponema sp.]|nr:tetratricopeptide repeat protein [Candidatus Treponema equifaecale]